MGATILVIEADPDLNRLLRFLLEHEGYTVATSFTVDGVVEQLRTAPPSLIVFDWDLDDLSGQALLDTLLTDSYLHTIPLLLICGRTPSVQVANALGLSGTPQIEKPFDVNIFNRQIAAMLLPRERTMAA